MHFGWHPLVPGCSYMKRGIEQGAHIKMGIKMGCSYMKSGIGVSDKGDYMSRGIRQDA